MAAKTPSDQPSKPSLIVYACPVGPLAKQLEAYLDESRQLCGENTAHAYMPHCTLTGFFTDEESAIPHYVQTLEKVWHQYAQEMTSLHVEIRQVLFRPNWHGLALEAEGLKRLVEAFAQQADSPTRTEAIRLKDWLHLSLAYDFPLADAPALQQMATKMIEISTPIAWELRFYQRTPHNQWTCHWSRALE
ncbi:MAG: hypothetical protein AAGL17_25185 [Cyanobacteria bacterium J06576_12]|mgnify:CR=1 FL=1